MGELNAFAPSLGEAHACGCVGPQNGEPYCPCRMRGVTQRDGRWIEPERDLGPVRPTVRDLAPRQEPIGCICPPTSEQTCERPTCPRKGIKVSVTASAGANS